MKTIIYLDVDGVINALGDSKRREMSGWETWDTAKINGYWISWSPELIERLNKLAARDDVEFRWLTTWQHDAATLISSGLDLDGSLWQVLVDPHEGARGWRGDKPVAGGSAWWKLDAIKADVSKEEEPVRLVWIDDDLHFYHEHLEWVTQLRRVTGHLLMTVCPRSELGISTPQMELIENFADGTLDEDDGTP